MKTHNIADNYLPSLQRHLLVIHWNYDPILGNLTDERKFDAPPLSFEHLQLDFCIALFIVSQGQLLDLEPVRRL